VALGISNHRLTWAPPALGDEVRRSLVYFAAVFALPRDPEPEIMRGTWVIWGLGAAMTAFVAIWVALSDFHVNAGKAGSLLAFLSVIAISCHFVRIRLRLQTPPALIESFAQFSFVSVAAVLMSFLLGSVSSPWGDPWLARFDQAMGFDWVGVNQFAADHLWLAWLLRASYQTFAWQPAVVLVLLAFRMSHRRLQMFVLAWTLAMIFTLVGLAIAPAQTAYIFHGQAQGPLPDLSAQVGNAQFTTLEALRAGGLRNLLNQDFEGIVAFPSFHTSGAIVFAWALWPLAWVRWPALVVNALMIASVPVVGAHYLIDVLAGILVAVLALMIAHAIDGRIALAAARPPSRS
jgi:membrane-associated phospholipid phosphatase